PLIAQTLYYSKNVESFGTGLKRIADACDAAGCKYKFEVLKSGFVVVFYRSDENFDTTGTDTTPVTIPVNTPDKDIRSKIVSLCLNAPQTREQLMQACGMKNKAHFLKAYLKPMLETGELQLTVPDKPNSRNQKYIAVRHTTGEVR
ncbi:MAG: Fic family protein, partial [Christensenellaceae bacterium]